MAEDSVAPAKADGGGAVYGTVGKRMLPTSSTSMPSQQSQPTSYFGDDETLRLSSADGEKKGETVGVAPLPPPPQSSPFPPGIEPPGIDPARPVGDGVGRDGRDKEQGGLLPSRSNGREQHQADFSSDSSSSSDEDEDEDESDYYADQDPPSPNVAKAIAFLTHRNVTDLPIEAKVSYLQSKGLSSNEINDASRRMGEADELWSSTTGGGRSDGRRRSGGGSGDRTRESGRGRARGRRRRRRRARRDVDRRRSRKDDDEYGSDGGPMQGGPPPSGGPDRQRCNYPNQPTDHLSYPPDPMQQQHSTYPPDPTQHPLQPTQQQMQHQTSIEPPSLAVPVTLGGILGVTAIAGLRWLNGGDFVLFPPPTTTTTTTNNSGAIEGEADEGGAIQFRAGGEMGESEEFEGEEVENEATTNAEEDEYGDDVDGVLGENFDEDGEFGDATFEDLGEGDFYDDLGEEEDDAQKTTHLDGYDWNHFTASSRQSSTVIEGGTATTAASSSNPIPSKSDVLTNELQSLTTALQRYTDVHERTLKAKDVERGRDMTNSAMDLLRKSSSVGAGDTKEADGGGNRSNNDQERAKEGRGVSTTTTQHSQVDLLALVVKLTELKCDLASLRTSVAVGSEGEDDPNNTASLLLEKMDSISSAVGRIEDTLLRGGGNSAGRPSVSSRARAAAGASAAASARGLATVVDDEELYKTPNIANMSSKKCYCDESYDEAVVDVANVFDTTDPNDPSRELSPINVAVPPPATPTLDVTLTLSPSPTPPRNNSVSSSDGDDDADAEFCVTDISEKRNVARNDSKVGTTRDEALSHAVDLLSTHPTNDTGDVRACAQMLYLYMVNLSSNPTVQRYRRIYTTNANFRDRVGKVKGGLDLLEAVGFVDRGSFMEWDGGGTANAADADSDAAADAAAVSGGTDAGGIGAGLGDEESNGADGVTLLKKAAALLSVLKVVGKRERGKGPTPTMAGSPADAASSSREPTPPPPPPPPGSGGSTPSFGPEGRGSAGGTAGFETPKGRGTDGSRTAQGGIGQVVGTISPSHATIISPPETKKMFQSEFEIGVLSGEGEGAGGGGTGMIPVGGGGGDGVGGGLGFPTVAAFEATKAATGDRNESAAVGVGAVAAAAGGGMVLPPRVPVRNLAVVAVSAQDEGRVDGSSEEDVVGDKGGWVERADDEEKPNGATTTFADGSSSSSLFGAEGSAFVRKVGPTEAPGNDILKLKPKMRGVGVAKFSPSGEEAEFETPPSDPEFLDGCDDELHPENSSMMRAAAGTNVLSFDEGDEEDVRDNDLEESMYSEHLNMSAIDTSE